MCVNACLVCVSGFINSQAPGQLTRCDYNFSFLVWQSRKSCSYKEILVRNVLPAVKISYPYAEKVIETPVVLLGSLRNHNADDEDNIS